MGGNTQGRDVPDGQSGGASWETTPTAARRAPSAAGSGGAQGIPQGDVDDNGMPLRASTSWRAWQGDLRSKFDEGQDLGNENDRHAACDDEPVNRSTMLTPPPSAARPDNNGGKDGEKSRGQPQPDVPPFGDLHGQDVSSWSEGGRRTAAGSCRAAGGASPTGFSSLGSPWAKRAAQRSGGGSGMMSGGRRRRPTVSSAGCSSDTVLSSRFSPERLARAAAVAYPAASTVGF